MLNEPTVNRNVVLLFDKKLNSRFIELSRKISKVIPSKIILNLKNEFPHITLYMTQYPKRNVPKILDVVSKIAKSTKSFRLILNTISCHRSGTIFVDAEISPALLLLHEKLVDGLNPLREGLCNDDELNLPGITDKVKKSLINFGMWAVKQDYVPHISIARVAEPKKEGPIALGVLPKTINIQTVVDQIAWVERGHDGTCKKVLHKFPLTS